MYNIWWVQCHRIGVNQDRADECRYFMKTISNISIYLHYMIANYYTPLRCMMYMSTKT